MPTKWTRRPPLSYEELQVGVMAANRAAKQLGMFRSPWYLRWINAALRWFRK